MDNLWILLTILVGAIIIGIAWVIATIWYAHDNDDDCLEVVENRNVKHKIYKTNCAFCNAELTHKSGASVNCHSCDAWLYMSKADGNGKCKIEGWKSWDA